MFLSSLPSKLGLECRNSLRRVWRDDFGATAITTGLLLMVLAGFVGLGTEVGMWYAERREMQSASDAAAMGAAFDMYKHGKDSEGVADAGQADATKNGFTNGLNDVVVEVNHPPTTGKYADKDTAVETVLTKTRPTLFGALFMGGDVEIKVRSVATVKVVNVYCILALAAHESKALFFSGTADVLLKNCGINVNSDDPTGAMTAQGSSVVGATYADIVGGLTQSNNAELDISDINTGADAVDDPYANLNVPPHNTCNFGTPPKKLINSNGNVTLQPGVYCGGLEIRKGTVFMQAGNYIIAGGDFIINGQAHVTSDSVNGVTIFLTERNGVYGQVNVNGGGGVNITAAKSGDYMGIAFFQDRNAPIANSGSPNTFNGGSTLNVTGALYFPKQLVQFNGGNMVNGTCTRIVAYMINMNGTNGLNTDCGYGFGTPQIYPPVLAE